MSRSGRGQYRRWECRYGRTPGNATMGAAGMSCVLEFSALEGEPPARFQSVDNANDDVSMLFLPFKASDHQAPELVPDLSAGTAGSAIPAAGSAPTPAARYRGGRILPAETPPTGNATPPLPIAAPAPVSQRCGTRARASRGRPVRRRGSRRGTASTRAGPDSDAGDAEPGPRGSGHLTAINGGATPAQHKGGGGWDRR